MAFFESTAILTIKFQVPNSGVGFILTPYFYISFKKVFILLKSRRSIQRMLREVKKMYIKRL